MRLLIPIAFGTVVLAGAAIAADRTIGFDDAGPGPLPAGWRVGATNGGGKPARWAIEQTDGPRGRTNVLSLVEPEGTGLLARLTVSNTFNIAWLPAAKARDLDVSVSIRANKGDIDQGGGLIWRAKDTDNYYLARYNPLEKNYRIYYVKDARRIQLATVENLRVGTGEWFVMRIVQRGPAIEAYLNGQRLVELRDTTFADAGAVGFWTKADAATSFDDLAIKEF